ncbi:MAG TPA: ribosome maturation factor RimP [Cytophagaceae bacterium]|jgi:ribosome maturation factor RimP
MMDIKEKVKEIVSNNLQSPEHFIVDVNVSGSTAVNKITVLLDGDNGISIDECARISRMLSKELEEMNFSEHPYLLEIGSPGVDKPLKLTRQYHKNIGRKLSVLLNDDNIVVGKLESVQEDRIVILEEKKEKGKSKKIVVAPSEVLFSNIKKTNVLVSFN